MGLIKQVVKKYFLNFRLSKKQLLFDLLLLLILGLVFPLYPAHAIFGIFGGVADAIGKSIGGVIAGFLTAVPAAIFGIAALILQWTLDPAFIRVPSYTSGAIVDIGWPIVRDLANMMIVLVLVVIGLTTALRLEEYPTRKLLPRLVFVALLINFTPVIMGVIVDACNIVMYFFLDGLMGVEATTRVFAAIHSVVVSDLSNFNFFNPLQQWLFMQKITIIWIFYLLASIIYLLFAFLFIMRRIAIWMLVIFSPIAFVAYILPFTRGLFRTWWHQFIQWSIIGVFCAFFLYLGDHIIGLAGTGAFVGSAPGGFGGWVVRPVITMLEQMMPFIIALIFLFFGFFVALSTSAMGASGIVAGAQRATKAGATVLRREAWEKGKAKAQETAAKSEKWRRASERLALSEAPKEVKIMGKERPVVSPVARWGAGVATAIGRPIGRAGLATREAGIKEIERKEDEAKKWKTPEMKLSHMRSAMTKAERIGTYYAAIESNQLKTLEKLGLTPEEKEKIGKEALEIHPEAFKKFRATHPTSAPRVAEGFSEEIRLRAGMTLTDEDRRKGRSNIFQKIMAEAKVEDIAKMAPSEIMGPLAHPQVKAAMHEFWGGPQIAAAGRTFGKSFIDDFMTEADRRGHQWYEEYNPKVTKYLHRTTAQELGFYDPRSLKPGEKMMPGPPTPPPGPPPPPPPPGPPPPRGRPGVGVRPPGERPPRPPRGRPGIGVEPGIEEELRKIVEERGERGEEELRKRGWKGPRGRPGLGGP